MAPLLSLRGTSPFVVRPFRVVRTRLKPRATFLNLPVIARHASAEAISCYNGAMTDEEAGNNKKGNPGHQPCNPLWSIDKVSVLI